MGRDHGETKSICEDIIKTDLWSLDVKGGLNWAVPVLGSFE